MERNVDDEFTREPFSSRPSDPMRDGLAYTASSSSSSSSARQHRRRADPKRFQSVRPFRAEEEPPRERVRHRPPGANGHRTTNFATRRTTAKQSHAQEQTGWFGNSQRKRGPDGFFGLFRAKRPRAGSEDEQNDARNHGTQVRVRINGAERQVIVIP